MTCLCFLAGVAQATILFAFHDADFVTMWDARDDLLKKEMLLVQCFAFSSMTWTCLISLSVLLVLVR